METYNLNDLLEFWKRQKKDEFRVIEAIVHLIEYDKIPDENKRKVIIETLRKYGLFEVDFIGDKDSFFKKQSDVLDKAFEEAFEKELKSKKKD